MLLIGPDKNPPCPTIATFSARNRVTPLRKRRAIRCITYISLSSGIGGGSTSNGQWLIETLKEQHLEPSQMALPGSQSSFLIDVKAFRRSRQQASGIQAAQQKK
ncbi:hypothetical protein XPA_004962 [Xanthoria parietina]